MQLQEKAPKTTTGSALYQLLYDMAKDPEVFEQYKNDVNALIAKYDLTDEQKELIRQGGQDNYIKLLVAERAKHFGDFTI